MNKHLRCREHKKLIFRCNETAQRYAIYLLNNRGWEMRVYWDDWCRCYHLTSDLYGRGG
jgi:hypothetical protein